MIDSIKPVRKKRPVTVTIVALLFILAGLTGFIYHSLELFDQNLTEPDALWILAIRILAVICGWFMLRGANWARWLSMAWLAYHVVLSAFHSVSETVAHLSLLVVFAALLFLPKSSVYFSKTRQSEPNK